MELLLWKAKKYKFMVLRYEEIRVSIGLLPLILIVLWNETVLWRVERNHSWCWWDMKENARFWSKCRVVTPYFDCLMKWNPVMKVWRKLELMLMRGKEKLLGFSVRLWLFIWTVILLDPLLFLLDRSSCVSRVGGGRGGGCLDPSPAPALHLYITNHLTSLTSFKTMFNIVYKLASFKTIICNRGGWG